MHIVENAVFADVLCYLQMAKIAQQVCSNSIERPEDPVPSTRHLLLDMLREMLDLFILRLVRIHRH